MKKVSILGATGSVGRSTLDVLRSHPDKFQVQAVTAHSKAGELATIAKSVNAKLAVVADFASYPVLKDLLAGTNIKVAAGPEAVLEAAAIPADCIMAAIVGMSGLLPVLKAIEQGTCVAIANKEPLVAAGPLIIEHARRFGTKLLPVDSEHNAIFQVFDATNMHAIDRIILTASGGPFRTCTKAQMQAATPAQAIAHPNWSMGAKISVDSATMMNKALEVVEAQRLFDMPPSRIDVLIHPQSIVHSMVEYSDGSVLAQLGAPDMRTPIAYALGWPDRIDSYGQKLDFTSLAALTFYAVNADLFPAVSFAYECMRAGDSACIALNAANEVAVGAFLEGRLGFSDIVKTVIKVTENTEATTPKTLEEILAIDQTVRARAELCIAGATRKAV